MELNPKIKQALIKIDFVKRYEELSPTNFLISSYYLHLTVYN